MPQCRLCRSVGLENAACAQTVGGIGQFFFAASKLGQDVERGVFRGAEELEFERAFGIGGRERNGLGYEVHGKIVLPAQHGEFFGSVRTEDEDAFDVAATI